MIKQLSVRGLAVVGDVTLELGSGFTVITGETGAGKTMLVHAIDVLRGGKPDPGRIAAGAEELSVEAVFELPPRETSEALWVRLDEVSAIVEGSELIVSRVVRPNGRGGASVGGRTVPLAVLAEVTDELLALHGQHSARLLTKVDNHRRLLDEYAGDQHLSKVDEYRAAYRRVVEIDRAIADAHNAKTGDAIVAEALARLVEDCESLALVPGEDSGLKERARQLQELLVRQTALMEALALITNDEGAGAADLLSRALRTISAGAAHIDRRSSAVADAQAEIHPATAAHDAVLASLDSASARIRDAVDGMLLLLEGAQEQAEELDRIQRRRAEISAAVRRHAAEDAEDLLAKANIARMRLDEMQPVDLGQLQATRAEFWESAMRSARKVSEIRTSAASRLSHEVGEVLRDLGFADGTFVVEIEQVTPNSHGCDSVEFRLSTRAGVEPVSLASGVSGGEMSRISLALTTVAAIADALPALVFDEVDAGIGGNTAHAVGRCLTGLASQTQVLAVTHLPQVAAVADQQWVVTATRTGAELRVVDGPTRVSELCRMLGLDPAEDVARQVAAAMLATP